jgi:hypothetical protein
VSLKDEQLVVTAVYCTEILVEVNKEAGSEKIQNAKYEPWCGLVFLTDTK